MLERDNNDLGSKVKSFHFKPPSSESSQAAKAEAWTYFVAASDLQFIFNDPKQQEEAASEARYDQGSEKVAQKVFNRLKNLETLILEDLTFIFSFQLQIDGKLTQHTFLTSSLRKLYIPRVNSKMFTRLNLSSMNVIWLLIFIPHLKEAALGVSVTLECLKVLSELSETFTGLSKVEKLALDIGFDFVEADRRTWWGVAGDPSESLLGESKKTESVHRMLSVLNASMVQCLELSKNLRDSYQRRGDFTYLTSSCFLSLKRPFRSVKHLRLFGFGSGRNSPISNDLSYLENLRILALDYYALFTLLHSSHQLLLPTSIEILCLPFYSGRTTTTITAPDEEKVLADLIESNALHNLKEVVIPSNRIGPSAKPLETQHEKIWTESRRALERLEIFKSGKVRLRTVQPGEKSECLDDSS